MRNAHICFGEVRHRRGSVYTHPVVSLRTLYMEDWHKLESPITESETQKFEV